MVFEQKIVKEERKLVSKGKTFQSKKTSAKALTWRVPRYLKNEGQGWGGRTEVRETTGLSSERYWVQIT